MFNEYKIIWPFGNVWWNCFKNCTANFPLPAWMALINTGNDGLVEFEYSVNVKFSAKKLNLHVASMYIVTWSNRYVDSVDEMANDWSLICCDLTDSTCDCCCKGEVFSYDSTLLVLRFALSNTEWNLEKEEGGNWKLSGGYNLVGKFGINR